MARIVVTTHGTLGDTLPLIALARELQERGHDLLLVLNDRMHEAARSCGLACVSSGRESLGAEEARRHAAAWNHLDPGSVPSDDQISAALERLFVEALPPLREACQGADLLLATPQQQGLAIVLAEALEIPVLAVSVTPSLHCVELSPEARARTDAPSLLDRRLEEQWLRARRSLGLPALPTGALARHLQGERLLLGSSPHFSRPAAAWSHAVQTGFWFHEDPRFAHWQPEPDLRAFMEQDPAPLLLSFSSQPLEDSRAIVAVHVRAAALLGRPILIQQGWADFRPEHLPPDCDRSRIRFEGFLPQDWLFRHAAALIHHGGIGTTARALRNDCPMLVEPFGNDQFFNARQIVGLGLGAAMHPQRLRQDAVAEVLERRVLTPETRQRVAALGAAIRAERGLETAADGVESLLGEARFTASRG